MPKEFEVHREVVLPAGPQDVFAAVSAATGAWMFPKEEVPAVGGTGPGDAGVVAWEPPGRFAVRVEGEDGWFNSLEYLIEPREPGTTLLRYTHRGVFAEDWENRFDACDRHTDFYLHTLGQYLGHFNGRPVVYAAAEGPAASAGPDGFDLLLDELHLDKEVRVGDRLSVELDEVGVLEAEVDYRTPQFLGLRAADGLYRFFGRNAFGGPVGVTVHLFGDGVDPERTGRAWQAWLDGLYGGSDDSGSNDSGSNDSGSNDSGSDGSGSDGSGS
ncbi:SRPBCC domain-containing protein [Kitasatospora sp. NBC_00315]|uniref:SRPBCC family protein n=1 Tax=Kitasatospora sp. NBC_00315 TaxID=2975963 RepID=UPI003244E794